MPNVANEDKTVETPAVNDTDIDRAYPESYTDDEKTIGNTICDYLNGSMSEYTKSELTGVIKFAYDFFGVLIDYGWENHPGWFLVTKDMAYDQFAVDHADAE